MHLNLLFSIILSLFLSSCNSSKDSSKTIAAPGSLSFPVSSLVLDKNVALPAPIIPSVSGESLRFTVAPAFPSGLFLHPNEGYISGIPTQVISDTLYTITAKNDGGSSSFQMLIRINDKPIPSLVYPQSTYSFTINQSIAPLILTPQGANFDRFEVTPSLPAGLVFNNSTGQISGSPLVVSTGSSHTITGYTVPTEQSNNQSFPVSTGLSFVINDIPANTLSYPNSNSFVLRRTVAMSPVLPTWLGGSPLSFSISPALPTGLTFNTLTGQISGTPSVSRTPQIYTVTALNSGGVTSRNITIEILDLPPQNLSYGASSFLLTRTVNVSEFFPTASGGLATNYSVSPALPTGLIFNNLTGSIKGVPSVVIPLTTYTVTASNSGGSTIVNLNIRVKDLPPQNLTYPVVSEILVKNTPITSWNPTSSGGAVSSYTIVPSLPVSLNFNTTTGVISGTPTAITSSAVYTVTASNSEGSSQYSFFLAVKDEAPTSLSYSPNELILTKGTATPTLIPSNSAGRITTYSIQPVLPSGLSLQITTGQITGTPTQLISRTKFTITGSNSTGVTTADIHLTVNDITPSGLAYSGSSFIFDRGVGLPTYSPSNLGGAIIAYSVSPALPAGITLDGTTGEISGIPSTFGSSQSYTITGTNSGGSTSVTISIGIRDFAPTNLYYGDQDIILRKNQSLGIAGIAPFYTGGAIVSFSVTPALPAGLFLAPSNGAILGTPTVKTNLTSYTITGTNSGGSTSVIVKIKVNDEPPVIQYSSAAFSFQRNNVITAITPTLSGGAITSWELIPTTLPTGLSFNSSTGVITGTGTVVTLPQSYTVRARNDGGAGTFAFTIAITEIPPSNITYSNTTYTWDKVYINPVTGLPPNGTVAQNITPTVGGGPVVSWSISPALPTGLSFNTSNGNISGIPTFGTDFVSYTISASNAGGTATRVLSIKIKDIPPNNLQYTPDIYAFDTADEIFIGAPSSSGGTITNYAITPALPTNLVFDPLSGEISKIDGATVPRLATRIFTVTASNSEGTTSDTFSLTLNDSPPQELRYYEASPYFPGVTVFTYSYSNTYSPINDGGFIDTYTPQSYSRVLGFGPNYPTDPEDLILQTEAGLPIGISYNTTTGVLSGTPSASNAGKIYRLIVKGANSGGETTGGLLMFFNTAPVPNAGLDLQTTINLQTTLNGSASSDADNASWQLGTFTTGRNVSTYSWSLISKPSGSAVSSSSLINPTTSAPRFTPDRLGTYTWRLTVNDGIANSLTTDDVVVTVVDVPPSALTYGNQGYSFDKFLYQKNAPVSLTPTADGGTITSFSISPASLPTGLSFNTTTGVISGTPTTNLNPSNYTVTASNSGGSTTVSVRIWINNPPVAQLTAPSKVNFPTAIALNASGSTDSDFSFSQASPYNAVPVSLVYSWKIISKPAGSVLTDSSFSSLTGSTTTIVPDQKGTYIFEVSLNDGYVGSNTVTQTVRTGSAPSGFSYSPQVRSTTRGQNLSNWNPSLSGDAATYTISPALPTGITMNPSTGVISGTPSVASLPQNYTVTASNNGGDATFVLTLWVNEIPTVNAIANVSGLTKNTQYTFSGVSVTDSDASVTSSHPSYVGQFTPSYTWDVIAVPGGSLVSNSLMTNRTTASPSFTPDQSGSYIFRVSYNDGLVNSSNNQLFTVSVNGFVDRLTKPIAKIQNAVDIASPSYNLNTINKNVSQGQNILLDGTLSQTFGSNLSYQWNLLRQPVGSSTTILDETLDEASLYLDLDGIYTIELIVDDGVNVSKDYLHLITTSSGTNQIAQTLPTGTNLLLDRAGSPHRITGYIDASSNNTTITIEDGAVVIGSDAQSGFKLGAGKIIANGCPGSNCFAQNSIIFNNINVGAISGASNPEITLSNVIWDTGRLANNGYDGYASFNGKVDIKKSRLINTQGLSVFSNATFFEIEENMFINTSGIQITTTSIAHKLRNNFVYNPQGDGTTFYFLRINQNTNQTIQFNQNWLINTLNRALVNSSQTTSVAYNYWKASLSLTEITTWITNPSNTIIIPFNSSINDVVPDGRRYLP